MPQKSEAAHPSSYEQPGRVAGYSNMNIQNLVEDSAFHSRNGKFIPVFSEKGYFDLHAAPIGEIQLRAFFSRSKDLPIDMSKAENIRPHMHTNSMMSNSTTCSFRK